MSETTIAAATIARIRAKVAAQSDAMRYSAEHTPGAAPCGPCTLRGWLCAGTQGVGKAGVIPDRCML